MSKRKKYILDKRFQFKTTFSIIGITSLIVSIIIGLMSFNIASNNKKLSNIILIQQNVVEALFTYSQTNRNREERTVINNISKSHTKNIDAMEDIINLNYKFLIAIIVITIIQCFVLFIIIIKKTHRISGPIYVMSQYMNDIINGKYPKPRPLRKGDELKEIYKLFSEMIETMKEREGNK